MKKNTQDESLKHPVAGVGWYTLEQWRKLKRVAVDRTVLDQSYDQWVDAFIAGCRVLENAGIKTVKIPIDVDELVTWCRRNALEVDEEARSRYVTGKLRSMNRT